jgi:ribonuclease VapC
MVIDTSAAMAILQREPEAEAFARAIEAAPTRLISAVSVLEAGMLVEARKREAGAVELDFGDCAAYALASTRGEPLLFKGDGFPQTDVLVGLATTRRPGR